MKVRVDITVHKDNGVQSSTTVYAETLTPRQITRGKWTRRETKAELRKRIEGMVETGLNSTLGR